MILEPAQSPAQSLYELAIQALEMALNEPSGPERMRLIDKALALRSLAREREGTPQLDTHLS
jgi:hypothetical protein